MTDARSPGETQQTARPVPMSKAQKTAGGGLGQTTLARKDLSKYACYNKVISRGLPTENEDFMDAQEPHVCPCIAASTVEVQSE